MVARVPSALLFSVLLHAAVVVAILSLAFAVQQAKPPVPHVFELVAGPGNDYAATEAPAKGLPDGAVNMKIPKVKITHVEPVQEAQEEEAPPKPSSRQTAKDTAGKSSSKIDPKMSYDEYVKKHGKPTPKAGTSSGSRGAVPKIHSKGIVDGVEGGSPNSTAGAGGTALAAAMHSAMEGYLSRLVAVVRQNHEKPAGLSDLLTAEVAFTIAADGTISRIHVVKSSGNAAFDQSCIEALARMRSIGPKPDKKTEVWTLGFRMKED